jgi:broad specificity phosphatase PhoE
MKLILTRHGETVENKKNIMQGHLQGHLSKEGILQAKKLALRLKNEKIDAIYSSDLKRAKETAKEIAKFHPNIPFHLVNELREIDIGPYEGKPRHMIDWNNRRHYKGVESRTSMRIRGRKILNQAYQKYSQGTVIFVGHAGINKALISVILNKPAAEMNLLPKIHNTSISIFEIREDKKHKMHLMNCIKHLE